MNLVLLLFIHIFGETASIEPRSVNLALDTILEFNNKDNTDLQIIDNVQEFLDKIKNILKANSGRRSMNTDFKFTDFLIDFFEIINNYNDDDLEDVVTVVDDEIRKYHYAGCRFFELLQNNDMRKFVGRKLGQIKRKTPDDIRHDLENILNVLKTQENDNIKDFLQYINTLYPKKSKNKLKNILNNIELYKSKSKRANLDLIKVIREGLRNAIFDHYTNLNVNARKDFKIRLESFWKNFMNPYQIGHKVWNLRYTKFDERGGNETTSTVSLVNREFNDQTTNVERVKDIDDFKHNTLQYFDGIMDYTTQPKEIEKELKHDTKNSHKEQFPDDIEVTTKTSYIKNNMNIISTVKDVFSQIKFLPIEQQEIKSLDKSIFGQFNDDVTSKNIVKEFEKTIDLNLPDIPTMVKQKFASITKERLLKTKEMFKDIGVDIHKTTKTNNEKNIKIHKTKINNIIKHESLSRFSIVSTEKTVKPYNFYDSEEIIIYNIHTKKTKPTKKRKPKTTTKRKHKKLTKRTTKSRLMTLFIENYTGKVKKIRARDKTTPKPKHTWKEVNKHRSKDKKEKTKRNRYTFINSDEYTKRTTRTKSYKDHRHEKPSQYHKKYKTQKKNSKRFEKATKKSRKWLKLPTTASYEGISIESFEEKSYRKNIDSDDFQNHTTKIQDIINITKSISTTTKTKTVSERIVSPTIQYSSFGPLDFWQGSTKFRKPISQGSSILPNATKTIENTTIMTTMATVKPALRSLNSNNTFGKEGIEKLKKNETIRLIDLDDIKVSTKLPITTKTETFSKDIKTKANNVKSTKSPQKITVIKSTSPPLKRRSIGVATTNKMTTTKKTTTATKIIVTTPNSTIMANATKPTFNLGEFLNQSEVLNVEDKEKKDKIKEKILKDMQSIFSPTTTTSTTEASMFTDPFNEIENALDLD